MLLQPPGGDLLPSLGSSLPSPGFQNGQPASVPFQPNQRSIPDNIGWGTDRDNRFCMIIQIPPNDIAKFAQTQLGQEVNADIPEVIRNRVQRVLVRIGNERVERIPADPQTLADNRIPNATTTFLDGSTSTSMGGTVASIDPPRNPGILTAAQGGAGYSNNGPNASLNSEPILPNTPSSNDYLNQARPFGNTGSSTLDNRFTPNASPQDITPNASNPPRRDSFAAPLTKFPPLFQPSNGTAPVANGSYQSTNPPYIPQQNNSNSAPQNYTNNQNGNPNWFGSPNRPYVATNTNAPIFGNESNLYPTNQQPSPSQVQTQLYGQPAPQPPYSTANQYQNPPPSTALSQFAPIPIGNKASSSSQHLDGANEEQGKEKFLPFLLLISIVGNVYLGLWMNHLRTRYRILLSNMRGVPISNLA